MGEESHRSTHLSISSASHSSPKLVSSGTKKEFIV
jgi:hypothetical protein